MDNQDHQRRFPLTQGIEGRKYGPFCALSTNEGTYGVNILCRNVREDPGVQGQ